MSDADELPSALRPDQWAGQPGTRAPHIWLTIGRKRLSTLDLFGRDWVLLTEDERWRDASALASRQLGVRLDCVRVGADAIAAHPEEFRKSYGLGPTGAALIRPDGYITWRSIDLSAYAQSVLLDTLRLVAATNKTGERI